LKYNDVVAFIENSKRNPSKHDDEERGLYLNWIKHNKRLYAAGELKLDRVERFKELLALMEENKRRLSRYRQFLLYQPLIEHQRRTKGTPKDV